MSVLDGPLVFVDVETNGLNHIRGRIIEVAAIRTEGGRITDSFTTLVDPETELPRFITDLTGISPDDLRSAPTFGDIADELERILHGAVLVAHNVRFDYSFLKQEFGRLNRPFLPKQLCTVKLSRALYPNMRGHKLADLITRHGLSYSRRHRAYDDSAVLLQFIRLVRQDFPEEQIEQAVARQIRQPALPRHLEPELVRNLPAAPGIYIFEDEAGRPLYVGKSINIKKRVLSHFGRDHAESKEFKLSQSVRHISTQVTAGELSALLLESRLVKEMQPLYNRRLRRTDKLLIARYAEDAAGYYQVWREEAAALEPPDFETVLAVYSRRSRARDSLRELQRTFDLCPRLLGLEKGGHACFASQLGKCLGACAGREPAASYNRRLLTAFEHQRLQAWPFNGAVMIEEGSGSHGILVDQWCILGELAYVPDGEPDVRLNSRPFDLDTYEILRSFLSSKRHDLSVRPVDVRLLQPQNA